MRGSMKLKKQALLICLLVPSIAQAGKVPSYYPTIQEIYDNCRSAISSDTEDFMKTYCSARITGFLEEGTSYSCLNSHIASKPMEYEIAKAIVSHIENYEYTGRNKAKQTFLNGRSQFAVKGLVDRIYKCNQQQ